MSKQHIPTVAEIRRGDHIDDAGRLGEAYDALDSIDTRMQELHRSAGDNSLRPSERREWDALEAQRGELEQYRDELNGAAQAEKEARAQRVANSRARWGSAHIGMDSPPATARDAARRRLDGLRSVPDDGRERLTRSFDRLEADPAGSGELDLLSRWLRSTSDPAYARAVGKMFRDPENGHREFTREELSAYRDARIVQRAMSIGTPSAGGFMLPTHLDPSIMLSNAGVVDPIRRLARTETIATNEWNGISSAGVTASWDTEETEVSDDSPTLANPSVPTHKGAAFVAASIEAAEDTTIGDQVSDLFLDAKMRLEGAAFLTGSGSDEPTGVITALAAGQKVATATADTLVAADLTGLQADLSPRWQPRASWLLNLETINDVGSMETTNGSRRFAEVDNDRLLRKQLAEHSGLDTAGDTASAGNDNVALYGDFRQYLVVDRVGATVEYIPHLFGTGNNRPTGQRGWYMYWRTGGDALIDDAFRLLTS